MRKEKCPLCKSTLEREDEHSYLFYCPNKNCFMYCTHEIEDFNLLESQIARIKQEAKQEMFREIKKVDIGKDGFFVIEVTKLKEIKKKHGVETK